MQPLPTPVVEERLVLSDRATFETAEDSAKQWQALGIPVEVTQPGRWQVWAKRDVYNSPLLRRWLLQSLNNKGHTQPYLETQVLQEQPEVYFISNGDRYQVKQLAITASLNRIWVSSGAKNSRPLLYGGSLKVQPNAYGNFTLVNKVPLETYLRGVVPYEIGSQAPFVAIQSQTIIARTYALRNLRRFQADNYQLCASIHCQVYKGLSGATARTDKAIDATKSLVLTYQNELVDALYYSTSGGITAPFSDSWNGTQRSYLKAIIDAPGQVWDLSQNSLADEQTFRRFIGLKDGFNETGIRIFRWSKKRTIEQLSETLQEHLQETKHPSADFTSIKGMKIASRSSSGRILTLIVETDKGIVELHKTEIRSALRPLRSTLFYLEPIYDSQARLQGYKFIGGGFGHGVGLSQYGSYNLAKLGWSAAQILQFYYPGTTIQAIDDSIVFWQESN
ncbi:MAG: SpoIID/LytB domain-containing protein [Prochloraceae cyanobacterium]